jgi:hypothetical protein
MPIVFGQTFANRFEQLGLIFVDFDHAVDHHAIGSFKDEAHLIT